MLCSGVGKCLCLHIYVIRFVSAIRIKNVLGVSLGFFWVGGWVGGWVGAVEVWVEWFEEGGLLCIF